MKRVHIIENGTSGSQNIIISQGSAMSQYTWYCKSSLFRWIGSGAAVVDAFAHLAAVDLTVDDDVSLTSTEPFYLWSKF